MMGGWFTYTYMEATILDYNVATQLFNSQEAFLCLGAAHTKMIDSTALILQVF